MTQITTEPVRVLNPKKLGAWELPAQRTCHGEGYKPCLALLPDGQVIMVALFWEGSEAKHTYHEITPLWRSTDGGKTWSKSEMIEDMIGREQYLTCTADGTLFATCHLLPQDTANRDGVTHSYLHRSTDGGRSWQRTKIALEGDARCGAPKAYSTNVSRNIVELPDGTLLFGVSLGGLDIAYLWRSVDGGRTWDKSLKVTIGGYNRMAYSNPGDGFFSEDFIYRTEPGKLLHWIRVGPPSPMYPIAGDDRLVPTGNDQIDRTMLCESSDEGRTWGELRDFGDYGMHYVKVLTLRDGRLLLTYTQRSIFYPLGLRAILSYDDGRTWDFSGDQIIIEGKTPWPKPSGGGFGNTLQLPDGSLLSAYSYRGGDDKFHIETVRWSLP